MRRAGVEPAKPEGGWVTATEARQCPADASYSIDTGGSRTHRTRRFKFRCFASLQYRAELLVRHPQMRRSPMSLASFLDRDTGLLKSRRGLCHVCRGYRLSLESRSAALSRLAKRKLLFRLRSVLSERKVMIQCVGSSRGNEEQSRTDRCSLPDAPPPRKVRADFSTWSAAIYRSLRIFGTV